MPDAGETGLDYIALTADVVAAYVSNNSVRTTDLPALIVSVYGAMSTMASGPPAPVAEPAIEKPSPAQIRKSITHEALISFIDGMPYKTLKRHLTANGLDPHSYRERSGLPAAYPMVAASYAEQRSSLAKSIGLGVPGARASRTVKTAA